MKETVDTLKDDPDIDPVIAKGCALYSEKLSKMMSFPKDMFVDQNILCNKAYDAWLSAKKANDYSIFEPYLKKIIESRRQEYAMRDSDLPIYDQMLDDYEPGMRCEDYDAFFSEVKRRLVPLIEKVTLPVPFGKEGVKDEK